MSNKNNEMRFVGSTRKIADNFFNVGFTKEHLELLLSEVEASEKGWANINISTSKDGTKAYAYIPEPYEGKGKGKVVTADQSTGGDLPF